MQAMAASRKREVGYHEMKRAAARRASATGGHTHHWWAAG